MKYIILGIALFSIWLLIGRSWFIQQVAASDTYTEAVSSIETKPISKLASFEPNNLPVLVYNQDTLATGIQAFGVSVDGLLASEDYLFLTEVVTFLRKHPDVSLVLELNNSTKKEQLIPVLKNYFILEGIPTKQVIINTSNENNIFLAGTAIALL